MSAANFATCQFCSKPDDSIQVICESRCLICSRCQLVPVIRKLLIDHTEFSAPGGLGITNIINSQEDHNASNKINSNTASCSAIRGTCPICTGSISSNMLFLIQGFYDSLMNEDEDTLGKSNAELLLEENTPLISTFLKRFKTSYNSYDLVHVNLKAFVPSADKDKQKKKKKNDSEPENDSAKLMRLVSGLSLQDVHSGPVKLGIPSVLEFVLDCYCGMWQSMIRCGNESMLTMLMRQVCKKKYSQKTNDFRTKSILDSLMSAAGTEIPELMVFCNLVGILPKVTGKISAAWGHIATALLAAIHCDRCLKTNVLIDGFGNPTVNEFRTKLSKTILFQGYNVSATVSNSNKNIPLTKAFRIIRLLLSSYQPSFTMAPITSACVEHQSRLPWSAPSIAKLFNILIYVALFDQTISARLRIMQMENSVHSGDSVDNSVEHKAAAGDPIAAGKMMGKIFENAMHTNTAKGGRSNSLTASPKLRSSQSSTQLPAMSSKVPFQQQGRRTGSSVQFSLAEPSANTSNNAGSGLVHRRTNIGLDQANIQRSMKNAGRLDMLKSIDGLIAKVWSTNAHPYLFLDENQQHPAQYNAIMKKMLVYLGDLDITGTAVHDPSHDSIGDVSENSSVASAAPHKSAAAESKSQHNHHHHNHNHHVHLNTSTHHHHQGHHHDLHNPWEYLSAQEQPLHHLRMTTDQALSLADTLTISMHDFILVTISAWNKEYESIKVDLERVQLLQQRRQAITGYYDGSQAKMTAQERLTITRLLQWYKRDEELIGVDWDEVEEQSSLHYFPFSLPKTLLQKSRNELQVLTDQVMRSLNEQAMQNNAYFGRKPVNILSTKVNAHGSVASLIPHDSNNNQHPNEEDKNGNEDQDLSFTKGISGGTAIQDNLPADEIHLLVGQVSPRDADEGIIDAPSVSSSVELYMLASELERGMGYTNSIFPAFRKQELQLEQSMRQGIAEDDTEDQYFNHRHTDFHNNDIDDIDDDDDDSVSPEEAGQQWKRAKALTSIHLSSDKNATKIDSKQKNIAVLKRATSHINHNESGSLPDINDFIPRLDAPTLDPTTSGSSNAQLQQHGKLVSTGRHTIASSQGASLPDVHNKGSLIRQNRLQSPANGGERPPSGSLSRYQVDKKKKAEGGGANEKKEREDPNIHLKVGGSGVGHMPGKHINIVDMIDVDGEVLERSGLTPALSKTLQKSAKHPKDMTDAFIMEDMTLNTHPLEENISDFQSPNRIRSGSKLNRKPVHNVHVDVLEDKETKKFTTKIVVEENYANSAFQATKSIKKEGQNDSDDDDENDESDDRMGQGYKVGGGAASNLPPVLCLEDRRKFTRARLLSVVDSIAEDYHATIEKQKKARLSHVRTKVMQRSDSKDAAGRKIAGLAVVSNTLGTTAEEEDATANTSAASNDKGKADLVVRVKGKDQQKFLQQGSQTSTGEDVGDGSTIISSTSTLGQESRPTTNNSTSNSHPRTQSSNHAAREEQFLARPLLDLSHSVKASGKFVIDLTDSLVAESIVTKLVLSDTNINHPSFKLALRTYCNPWQLDNIRFIDFSGNPNSGGFMAAKSLGNAFSQICNLVELNINGMKIGDSGLACLLQGILQGGGHSFLKRLSLQQNDITMATNAISFLAHFSELKALDLSRNMFTLDTHAQIKYFTDAVEGLVNIEVLSLAFNKIQDQGFTLLLDLLLGQAPLRVLDVAGCFITAFSTENVRMILQATPKVKDKRYTTTMSMTMSLHAQENSDKVPIVRGLSRFLSSFQLINASNSSNSNLYGGGRDSMDLDLSLIDVPSNTRECSAYQPMTVPIQLEYLFMQESLIPQNVWNGLRDAMIASACKIYLHEEYTGVDGFPVFDTSEYGL